MKKNVSGQKIGAQMVSATDGSAFTGSVTVSVTGDAGTQATGSVGSGACAHEGNGYHTYAPAQAETNYDLIAFTFTGTGAIPATVQVFTTFPQTGDNFARLGAPAGASIAADIATIDDLIDTEVAAIKAKTDNLPTDPADQSLIIAATDSIASAIAGLNDLSAAEVRAAVGLASADLDAQLDAINTNIDGLQQATIAKESTEIFPFEMFLTDTETLAVGKTVTAKRSLDGASWASAAGSVAAIGEGTYKFTPDAADSNCDQGIWKFSNADCKDTIFHFKTSE